MKLWPALSAALLLLALLTWLAIRGMTVATEPFQAALRDLDAFELAESSLFRDVLSARTGLLRNYDPLVEEVGELHAAIARLQSVAGADPATISRLTKLVDEQAALVEQFKSNNALLRNSLAYFRLLSAEFSQGGGEPGLILEVSTLAATMLDLTLNTSAENVAAVGAHLDALGRKPSSPADGASFSALLAHGRVLHDLLPATDALLSALFANSSRQPRETIAHEIMARQEALEVKARRFQLLLYAASIVLLIVLFDLARRLRARVRAIQRRSAFERLITEISTSFINARSQDTPDHIEAALARLADVFGADRAYALLAGPPVRVNAWCRQGTDYPFGWPQHALELADRIAGPEEEPIALASTALPPPRDDDEVLARQGLEEWLCVPRMSGGRVAALLGFDSLHPGGLAGHVERSLLPVALEVIANAAERELLEVDRARLETRLQRKWRMETVGALASGVAHNFNNIIGAILGHTEIAEAEGRGQASLLEIRRAGERARDLVGQILAFGHRKDGMRQRVDMHELLAETVSLLAASLPPTVSLAVKTTSEPAVVLGEPAQLQQVIVNLGRNAAQAMDENGRIALDMKRRVVTRPRTVSHGDLAPNPYLRIRVTDTGRGLDDATQARLFEPFFTTRAGGSGLGLATAREIVADHGGAINVRSILGIRQPL